MPILGRLFANNHRETLQTDIILTLTPHIVRVLDLTEADLRPFKLGREGGAARWPRSSASARRRETSRSIRPRRRKRRERSRWRCPRRRGPRSRPPFPQPLQGTLPGTHAPAAHAAPKKPGGGGSESRVWNDPTNDRYRTDYAPTLSTCAPSERSRSISDA